MRIFYTLLVGIPASLLLMTIGCLLCLTVIGFPAGLVCFGLGFKLLTIDSRRRTVVYVRR
jgi:Inner membrane component domain